MLAANEYLPIGSVVLLKGGIKKIMVAGIMPKHVNEDKTVLEFDYIGVMYPEGFLDMSSMLLFNNDQVNDVVYRGYENPERDMFVEKLSGVIALKTEKQSETNN